MRNILGVFLLIILVGPSVAAAQIIATPYWCGWGWSSAPCVSYTQPYSYGSYYYPGNYSYSYNYGYTNPCYPVSYDSHGNVVQTSCGVNYQYQYGYQHHQYPQYHSYYSWYDHDRHDDDRNRRDRDNDWHRDRDWDNYR